MKGSREPDFDGCHFHLIDLQRFELRYISLSFSLLLCLSAQACSGQTGASDDLSDSSSPDGAGDSTVYVQDAALDTGTDTASDTKIDSPDTSDSPTCSAPLFECKGTCANLSKDPANCGTCGKACGTGEVCFAGKCDLICSGGTEKCGNACVDTKMDNKNCGTCGTVCATGEVCSAGKCDIVCSGGTEKYGTTCVDTTTDSANCGTCGTACLSSESCIASKCVCSGGAQKCGAACVDTKTDPANCGVCGTACPTGETCVASTCDIVCTGDTSKCGKVCLNLQADIANCGACGNVCEEGAICDAGHCRIPFPTGLVCLPGLPIVRFWGDKENVVVADFNRDNIADIFFSGDVALGRGNGTFRPSTHNYLNVGMPAVAGDVNADGIVDIVGCTEDHRWVTVLLGIGDGTFQLANFDVITKPSTVALGDINNDGHLDIVFGANTADLEGVLLGKGDGTFSDVKLFAAPHLPIEVALADYTGDGNLDLSTALQEEIEIRPGDGNGNFGKPTIVGFQEFTDRLVPADLDGDGDVDIVAAGRMGIVVSKNLGKGVFETFPTPYHLVTNWLNVPASLAVADYDGDGDLDVATDQYAGEDSATRATVLLNNGSGKFSTKFQFEDVMEKLAVGDFTGDGRPDLVLTGGPNAQYFNESLQVLRNKGDGVFAVPVDVLKGSYLPSLWSTMADINKDGKPDFLYVPLNHPGILLELNDGKGSFKSGGEITTPDWPSALTTGDYNSDGLMDIAAAGKTWLKVWPNLGGGTFGAPVALDYSSPDDPAGYLTFCDLNGDGIKDLLSIGGSYLYSQIGQGGGVFTARTKVGNYTPWPISVHDWNGDGRDDVYGSGPVLLYGKADGTLEPGPVPSGIPLGWLSFGDMDGDGNVDIVGGGNNLHVNVVWTDGKGHFLPQTLSDSECEGITTLVDLNGDGKLDVVTVLNSTVGIMSVTLNKGSRQFAPALRFQAFPSYSPYETGKIYAADMNNDGAVDLLLPATQTQTGIRVFYNGCGK